MTLCDGEACLDAVYAKSGRSGVRAVGRYTVHVSHTSPWAGVGPKCVSVASARAELRSQALPFKKDVVTWNLYAGTRPAPGPRAVFARKRSAKTEVREEQQR